MRLFRILGFVIFLMGAVSVAFMVSGSTSVTGLAVLDNSGRTAYSFELGFWFFICLAGTVLMASGDDLQDYVERAEDEQPSPPQEEQEQPEEEAMPYEGKMQERYERARQYKSLKQEGAQDNIRKLRKELAKSKLSIDNILEGLEQSGILDLVSQSKDYQRIVKKMSEAYEALGIDFPVKAYLDLDEKKREQAYQKIKGMIEKGVELADSYSTPEGRRNVKELLEGLSGMRERSYTPDYEMMTLDEMAHRYTKDQPAAQEDRPKYDIELVRALLKDYFAAKGYEPVKQEERPGRRHRREAA